jgi:NAD(P)-dependent dehydrogenase (short-subunit alcohol dehydrogenase family)
MTDESSDARVAIVTGSSSGNGRGIALSLAEAGLSIVCADIRQAPREGGFDADGDVATDDLIRRRGGRSTYLPTDVSSAAQVQTLVDTAVGAFGRLDVLVNNAGIMPRDPVSIVDDAEEAFDRVMSINAKSVWLCTKFAVGQMMLQPLRGRTRGKVVNVASISGAVIGLPGFTPYAASKGAIAGMTMALAAEWAAEKITVNAIAPGFFPTAMTSHVYAQEPVVEALTAVVPMGELGRPEDLGGVVTFLASSAADYLTGQIIPIDGGYTTIGALPPVQV